jgi:ATP-dependent Clp protease ATP-binding subunit ClpC
LDTAFERMRERLTEELKKSLRPEFINRIDDIIIFRGLDYKDAVAITKLLIKEIEKRLKNSGIQIKVDEEAISYLAKQGFSEEYGARNIRRKLQELLENPLSDLFLHGGGKGLYVEVKYTAGALKFLQKEENKNE